MIETRVFVDSLESAKNILKQENAVLKGKYKIYDTIYRNIDKSTPLIEEFLRLREVPKRRLFDEFSIWYGAMREIRTSLWS